MGSEDLIVADEEDEGVEKRVHVVSASATLHTFSIFFFFFSFSFLLGGAVVVPQLPLSSSNLPLLFFPHSFYWFLHSVKNKKDLLSSLFL